MESESRAVARGENGFGCLTQVPFLGKHSRMRTLLDELIQHRLMLRPGALWAGSPFEWLRRKPFGEAAAFAIAVAVGYCAAWYLNVSRKSAEVEDRLIEGRRLSFTFSFLSQTGSYEFCDITDRNYDYLTCIGISPFDAHCWLIPKDLVRQHIIGRLPQCGWRNGRDSFRLSFAPNDPPDWLRDCGGKLRDAFRILRGFRSG